MAVWVAFNLTCADETFTAVCVCPCNQTTDHQVVCLLFVFSLFPTNLLLCLLVSWCLWRERLFRINRNVLKKKTPIPPPHGAAVWVVWHVSPVTTETTDYCSDYLFAPKKAKWVFPWNAVPPLLFIRHVEHSLQPPIIGKPSKMRSGGCPQTQRR